MAYLLREEISLVTQSYYRLKLKYPSNFRLQGVFGGIGRDVKKNMPKNLLLGT